MRTSLRRAFHSLLARQGYRIVSLREGNTDEFPMEFERIYARCRGYTMTSLERMYALYEATLYISRARITGSIVECGVWRGGSSMLTAMTLAPRNDFRDIWMYDTFEGMPPPSTFDLDREGKPVEEQWRNQQRADRTNSWCLSSIEETREHLYSTSYPREQLHFIKGKVEETLQVYLPKRIALLRLDTDWYSSTRHELQHLFPRLSEGGVLLIDDYGHWQGQRKAVDEYLSENHLKLLLNRIDSSGRLAIKCRPDRVDGQAPNELAKEDS